MLKVLVPVNGSANGLRAVRYAITEYQRHRELEVHLLNVQPRLTRHITRFVSRRDREDWLRERATAAMATAAAMLSQGGVLHQTHWATGDGATEICRAAESLRIHHIVLGVAPKNPIMRMFEDSVTERVFDATPVPVHVVVGEKAPTWQRWSLPAGVFGSGLLLWAAMD